MVFYTLCGIVYLWQMILLCPNDDCYRSSSYRQECDVKRYMNSLPDKEEVATLLEYVIVIARHRREPELLSVVVLDASLDGNRVGLEPVGGHRPRARLADFFPYFLSFS